MRTRTKLLVAAYLLACLVLDVFPRFGPPQFRYTGSDPAVSVWNLGWPMALGIHDARSGFHAGPSMYLVPPAQVFLLLLAFAIAAVVRWAEQTAKPSWGGPVPPGREA